MYLCSANRKVLMNKILYAFVSLLAFTSCAQTYNITGSSNMSTLDGQKLYLKVLKNNDFKNVDSCDVVHGQFEFSGTVDSACMANIFMDKDFLLPLVLEGGDITVKFDNTQQSVTGTPLNDKLDKFVKRYNQLKSQEAELVHRHDQAIMDGSNMQAVNSQLQAQAARLSDQEDKLVTNFVCSNFDNVLGPGVFFMFTIDNEYPMLSPWVEDIMSRATEKFKNDPYVKDYYQKAQENEQIMNGMKDAGPGVPPPPGGPDGVQQPQDGPTANDLARPTIPQK